MAVEVADTFHVAAAPVPAGSAGCTVGGGCTLPGVQRRTPAGAEGRRLPGCKLGPVGAAGSPVGAGDQHTDSAQGPSSPGSSAAGVECTGRQQKMPAGLRWNTRRTGPAAAATG